jgi:ATP-dependent DNA helicase RecG
MPLDPDAFQRRQVSTGAIDWSAQPAEDVRIKDLDPLEIARLRNVIQAVRRESPLLALSDDELLEAVGVVQDGKVTRAGLLLLGRGAVLSSYLPQHEVIYLHNVSPTDLDQRLDLKAPLLFTLEHLTEVINVRNPFRTLRTGLFYIDIPAYPEGVFREAILNALIHRDYLEGSSVYVRHSDSEMVISSPGGFIGGITPQNILHHEPKARNRLLAEMFQKIGLVERAGIGRRRIFIPSLAYGKRPPHYESDEHTVVLTLFNGYFDEALASFIATEQRGGRDFDLVDLLLLSYLREHPEINVPGAAQVTQLSEPRTHDVLDRLSQAPNAWLEKRGRTYYLSPFAAEKLLSRAAYTRARSLDKVLWPGLIRAYVEQHGSISNAECRELLGLGSSASAQVKASQLLSKLSGPEGFLIPTGRGKATRYIMLNAKKNT